jgi:hypothetical protein
MFSKLARVGAIVAILCLVAPGVQAITFGDQDGDLHPNVGALLAGFPDEPIFEVCSGTLIAPTVFLTAAHCTQWMQRYGDLLEVWVTFDPFPGAGSLLIPASAQFNPDYGHDEHDPHDVAVVLLDYAPEGITTAHLPTAGLLDEMKDNHLLHDQTFVTVGYGALRNDKTGGQHSIEWDNMDRYYVEQSFLALKPSWIQLSMNPSTGNGGTCYGDSGGPHFLGDTDIVVAVTVTGDRFCRATDVDYRMDIESARTYLSQFVDLP